MFSEQSKSLSKALPMSHREISDGWIISFVTKAGQEFSKKFLQNVLVWTIFTSLNYLVWVKVGSIKTFAGLRQDGRCPQPLFPDGSKNQFNWLWIRYICWSLCLARLYLTLSLPHPWFIPCSLSADLHIPSSCKEEPPVTSRIASETASWHRWTQPPRLPLPSSLAPVILVDCQKLVPFIPEVGRVLFVLLIWKLSGWEDKTAAPLHSSHGTSSCFPLREAEQMEGRDEMKIKSKQCD